MKAEDLKLLVKEKYGEIATKSGESSCCGSSCGCGDSTYTIMSDDYTQLKGYNPDADLGLGCGIPTQYAGIKEGDSVLDLGSGAGNDCFVARAIVGENGKVTGLDFTDSMLEKANINAKKLGYTNVEFIQGDIENMPLPSNTYDVVVSNCVLNLVPDKVKAFSEIRRVLKAGGHFCVSDVILKGTLPDKLKKDAEMYAGCISGAILMNDYLSIIADLGFKNTLVHKQKEITLPEEVLKNHLTAQELTSFKNGDSGIFSVTVSADKP